jgi:hypothetical protein
MPTPTNVPEKNAAEVSASGSEPDAECPWF